MFGKVLSAHRLVSIISTNNHLISILNNVSIFINTNHHRCFTSTVTNGLQFNEIIGPCKEMLTARKKLSTKVCPNSITQNWNIKTINSFCQLHDLLST